MSAEENGEVGSKKGIDLDDILVEEVGQVGRYQLTVLALVAFPVIFSGFTTEYVFTTARIPTRCLIPQCDGQDPEFSPPWLASALPVASGGFDQCARFSNSSLQDPDAAEACPASWFDNSTVVACDQYVYENTYSVVYEFGLACDEWRRSLIGSVRVMGDLLVLPLTGYVSDRWGRRVAVTINAFNLAWTGFARSFVNSYEWFLAMEVLESAIGAGTYSSCYILVAEMFGPKYRVITGASLSTMFAIGQIILSFIAWGVPAWRTLTRVVYGPLLLVISYYWLLTESVRWLMSKGRYEEAEAILRKVAQRNKKKLSDKSLEAFRESVEAEKNIVKPKEVWLPLQVLRSPVILSRCCVTPIWWITTTLVYYGMSVNAVNLSGNSYLNYAIVAAVEIPGYWTAILLLDRIGRKAMMISAYGLCAICQFTFAFSSSEMEGLNLAVYLIGKYSISIVVTSMYVYTAELYPTKYRHNLFAFSSMIGRIGSITAPLTPALALTVWANLPSVLFGSFALLSALLVLTTPETLGTKLPDTMRDAEDLASRKISTRKH
ncbi:organic cation transporter protein-like [Ostrinia furnacalis]|uniref:organic cation transporter protein-like n=1 Tax=Ostrinia furnacalis TaxID=93504 RepID=UPI0010397F69|nr:organic cation transporter protein-like [Ostrinia furnacalis]